MATQTEDNAPTRSEVTDAITTRRENVLRLIKQADPQMNDELFCAARIASAEQIVYSALFEDTVNVDSNTWLGADFVAWSVDRVLWKTSRPFLKEQQFPLADSRSPDVCTKPASSKFDAYKKARLAEEAAKNASRSSPEISNSKSGEDDQTSLEHKTPTRGDDPEKLRQRLHAILQLANHFPGNSQEWPKLLWDSMYENKPMEDGDYFALPVRDDWAHLLSPEILAKAHQLLDPNVRVAVREPAEPGAPKLLAVCFSESQAANPSLPRSVLGFVDAWSKVRKWHRHMVEEIGQQPLDQFIWTMATVEAGGKTAGKHA